MEIVLLSHITIPKNPMNLSEALETTEQRFGHMSPTPRLSQEVRICMDEYLWHLCNFDDSRRKYMVPQTEDGRPRQQDLNQSSFQKMLDILQTSLKRYERKVITKHFHIFGLWKPIG